MSATQERPSEKVRLQALSAVPAGWRVERAKVFFRRVDERSEKGEEELLSVSHLTGVTRRSEKNVTMFQAESYAGFKTCQAGDLVVNSMWTWMKALGVAWEPGIVSTAYGVYRLRIPEDWNLRFINYLVRCDFMGGEYLVRSKGMHSSRWLLSDDDFGNVPFICPPRPEQDVIVAYLDGKLERIDRYLRVKEREIALLEERKRALIHRAVTRGLSSEAKEDPDPNLPAGASAKEGPQLQPSGIPWLPEIPIGWRPIKAGFYMSVLSGYAFPSIGFTYDDDGIRLLRGINVGVREVRWDDIVRWPKDDFRTLRRFALCEGDLVMGMDRPWISSGMRVAQISSDDLPCLLLQRACQAASKPVILEACSLDRSLHRIIHANSYRRECPAPESRPDWGLQVRYSFIRRARLDH